jgi:hypothetical protein
LPFLIGRDKRRVRSGVLAVDLDHFAKPWRRCRDLGVEAHRLA